MKEKEHPKVRSEGLKEKKLNTLVPKRQKKSDSFKSLFE